MAVILGTERQNWSWGVTRPSFTQLVGCCGKGLVCRCARLHCEQMPYAGHSETVSDRVSRPCGEALQTPHLGTLHRFQSQIFEAIPWFSESAVFRHVGLVTRRPLEVENLRIISRANLPRA